MPFYFKFRHFDRHENSTDVILCLYKMKRTDWLLCLVKNCILVCILASTCGTQGHQHRGVSQHNNTYYQPSSAHLAMIHRVFSFSLSFFYC